MFLSSLLHIPIGAVAVSVLSHLFLHSSIHSCFLITHHLCIHFLSCNFLELYRTCKRWPCTGPYSFHCCFWIIPVTVTSSCTMPVIAVPASFLSLLRVPALFLSLLFLHYSCHCYKFLHYSCHCCSCHGCFGLSPITSCCFCIFPATMAT